MNKYVDDKSIIAGQEVLIRRAKCVGRTGRTHGWVKREVGGDPVTASPNRAVPPL